MSTLDIIAREVGVSARTVSNVLNGKNKENWGSTALRAAKIREVAERVGYQPNVMARAVATGKSRVVGLVVRVHGSGNDGDVQNGLLEELTLQDYTTKLLYFPDPPTPEHISQVAQQCAMWKLEGLIALTFSEFHMTLLQEQMERIGCSVTFVGGIPPASSLGVFSDSLTAVRLGLRHLVELGHRHIAFLGGDLDSPVTLQEMASFRTVMNEFELPVSENQIVFSDWSDADIIAEVVTRLLKSPQPPTAIFCNSSSQALVATSTARSHGLQVPRQLSTVCYGANRLSAYTDPSLTSLIQPSKHMGHIAVQQLLSHIQGRQMEPHRPKSQLHPVRVTEGIELVIRGSTVPPG